MSHSRLSALFVFVFLGGLPSSARAQAPEPDKKRALYTAVYDMENLLAKPKVLSAHFPAFRSAKPSQRGAAMVQAIYALLEDVGVTSTATIEVRNGTRLVVHSNGAEHAMIAQLFQSFRTLGDLSVIVEAKLHEVDDAFYTKLKNAKRIPIKESERQFLEGAAPKGESLFKMLEKQKLVLAREKFKVDDGVKVLLLSQHTAVRCLPSPEQVRRQETRRQTIVEGVAFQAGIRVSPDRRFIRVKLTERATELREIQKVKVLTAAEKNADAEVPIVMEATHTQDLDLPDGGSMLIPVHYRPQSIRAKNRWWVLSISPRIIMEAEEREIRRGYLDEVLPKLVADVLKDPHLKTTREFYGSPDDTRFALVNSDAWTWSKEAPLAVAGFQLTPAKREAQRLLGIRVDKVQFAEDDKNKSTITLTLLNAGGSTNGAVIGGCTIRYRLGEKAWVLETEP
jgi:hypothetical protein